MPTRERVTRHDLDFAAYILDREADSCLENADDSEALRRASRWLTREVQRRLRNSRMTREEDSRRIDFGHAAPDLEVRIARPV